MHRMLPAFRSQCAFPSWRARIQGLRNLLRNLRSVTRRNCSPSDSLHALQGTKAAEVIDALKPEPTHLILPKRRFSAFFKTDLDQTLRVLGVDTIAVSGMATEVCVLQTVMDGLSHDFAAIILEDCTASRSQEYSQKRLDLYRDFATFHQVPSLLSQPQSHYIVQNKCVSTNT